MFDLDQTDFCLFACLSVLSNTVRIMFSGRQTLKPYIAQLGVEQNLGGKNGLVEPCRDADLNCSNRKREVSEKLWRNDKKSDLLTNKLERCPLVFHT